MERYIQQHLGLTERSDEELRQTLNRFEAKWQQKARAAGRF